MKHEDREQILKYLDEGARALEQAVAGIGDVEARRVPDGGWSALELVEHVAISELFLLSLVMNGKPVADRPPSDPSKDAVVVNRMIGRERRAKAPVGFEPKGRFDSLPTALSAFHNARRATLVFVHACKDDLRTRHCEHPLLGLMPAYNCLLLLAAHPPRHAAQIREISGSGH